MTPIYDRTDAIARLGGDAELFAAAAAMFVAESETYRAALKDALATGDAALLRREAHTVKSMLATFSFASGRARALALEQAAAAGDLAEAPALAAAVDADIALLAEALADESAV
ncbi:MAG: Hpt domain-containing protein [Propionivibrio sp.]